VGVGVEQLVPEELGLVGEPGIGEMVEALEADGDGGQFGEGLDRFVYDLDVDHERASGVRGSCGLRILESQRDDRTAQVNCR
jgi:hypothetical protein